MTGSVVVALSSTHNSTGAPRAAISVTAGCPALTTEITVLGKKVTVQSDAVQPHLEVIPLSLKQANDYVTALHRHHKKVTGHKFSIGVVDDAGVLRGVCIVGRPIARHYDDGRTAEVTRTCTDGCPNANSALYAAAWRTAKGMGYRRLITYTQEGESGASLRGAGWRVAGERPARKSWHESSGPGWAAKRDPVGSGGVARTLWEVA